MTISTPQFTGQLGNLNSQFGFLALGYDVFNEIIAVWVGNRDSDDNPRIQNFGFDENGMPIILELGKLHILTPNQAKRAQANGATLISPSLI